MLAVTAVAGIALAVHGWSGRHAGLAAGSLAGPGTSPSAHVKPSAQTGGSSTPAATPSSHRVSPGATPGPLLRAQSFAAYSYQVWPGPPSPARRAALTGLSVSARRRGSGISVTADVTGQPAAAPRYCPLGARVYVVEVTLSDDSGNTDYNLGDDTLIVTDAQGRILR